MLNDRRPVVFLHQNMRRSSQVESQVGSQGDEEISSARSNFFLAAHDDDLSMFGQRLRMSQALEVTPIVSVCHHSAKELRTESVLGQPALFQVSHLQSLV